MFTGIVEALAKVHAVQRTGRGARLFLKAGRLAKGLRAGDSLCVDGVCLTVSGRKNSLSTFDLSSETLRVTTLGRLKQGEKVNLERPLKVGDRLGGHLVQGHVDGMGRIRGRRKEGRGLFLEISCPSFLNRYVVPKGSIAVDGVSLTIARKSKNRFSVFLIPETLKRTTLGQRQLGDQVNLEGDLLAKYSHRWKKKS